MKKIKTQLFVLFLTSLLLFGCHSNKENERISLSCAFVDMLTREAYSELCAFDYDANMQAIATEEMMKQRFEPNLDVLGTFIQRHEPFETKQENYDIVSVPCEFEIQNVNINIVFDSERKIAGVNFDEYQLKDN